MFLCLGFNKSAMRQTSLFSMGVTPTKKNNLEQETSAVEQPDARKVSSKPLLPFKIVNIIDGDAPRSEDCIPYEEFLRQWQMQSMSAWAFALNNPVQALVRNCL